MKVHILIKKSKKIIKLVNTVEKHVHKVHIWWSMDPIRNSEERRVHKGWEDIEDFPPPPRGFEMGLSLGYTPEEIKTLTRWKGPPINSEVTSACRYNPLWGLERVRDANTTELQPSSSLDKLLSIQCIYVSCKYTGQKAFYWWWWKILNIFSSSVHAFFFTVSNWIHWSSNVDFVHMFIY